MLCKVNDQTWAVADEKRQLMIAETDATGEDGDQQWGEVKNGHEKDPGLNGGINDADISDIDYQSGFEIHTSAMFSCAKSGSFGVDDLTIYGDNHEMNSRSEEATEYNSNYPQTQADNSCLEDWNQTSNCGVDHEAEETFCQQATENRELMENGTVFRKLEGESEEKYSWHGGNQDFNPFQADSQPLRQDFALHSNSAKQPLRVEVPEWEEQSGSHRFYAQRELIDGSSNSDPHADYCQNENRQKSAHFALPAKVEDSGHRAMYSNGQLIPEREGKNSGIVNGEDSESRDQKTGQSAGEDTLPRRGHTKALLAQWRELEQRRRDEELLERTAAVVSDRSRRAAVRTAWFKTPADTPQQLKGFAGTRSQSCGPATRRTTHDLGFDASTSRRNASVGETMDTRRLPILIFYRIYRNVGIGAY